MDAVVWVYGREVAVVRGWVSEVRVREWRSICSGSFVMGRKRLQRKFPITNRTYGVPVCKELPRARSG